MTQPESVLPPVRLVVLISPEVDAEIDALIAAQTVPPPRSHLVREALRLGLAALRAGDEHLAATGTVG